MQYRVGLGFLSCVLATVFAAGPLAAQQGQTDSPIVAKTRKKLTTPVSHEAKDQPLQELLKELGEQADVRFRLDPAVPKHKSFTIKVEEKSLNEVLAQLFEGSGLGYYVHRKLNANDRYEGYIDVVQGDQRGEETAAKGQDDKTEKGGKPPAKKPTPPPAERKKGEEDQKEGANLERLAASKLKLAKLFVEDGQKKEAIESLEEIVAKYPKTEAGIEAKALLGKLKK